VNIGKQARKVTGARQFNAVLPGQCISWWLSGFAPKQKRQLLKIKLKNIHILTVAAIAAAVIIAPSLIAGECSSTSKSASAAVSPAHKDIVAVASGADNFKTLVAAMKAAGLVETLQGDGPFTVFAPTDEAFAKLPKGTVEDLLKPENKQKLVAILTYHVVPGKVMASDVKTMQVKTVNSKELTIVAANGKVTVDNANVIKTDVLAGNGVIHVIDTVVLPTS
jgi:uncharacterized surface protein with fasciclin (FAS1) repeats